MRWASDSGSGSAVVSYTRAYLFRKEPLTMAQMIAHESPHATLLLRNAAQRPLTQESHNASDNTVERTSSEHTRTSVVAPITPVCDMEA